LIRRDFTAEINLDKNFGSKINTDKNFGTEMNPDKNFETEMNPDKNFETYFVLDQVDDVTSVLFPMKNWNWFQRKIVVPQRQLFKSKN
jgi:hypothetical protein